MAGRTVEVTVFCKRHAASLAGRPEAGLESVNRATCQHHKGSDPKTVLRQILDGPAAAARDTAKTGTGSC